MQALETSNEMLSSPALRVAQGSPSEGARERETSAPRGLGGAPGETPELPPSVGARGSRRGGLGSDWHVPLCVLLSVGVHAALTTWMPTASAHTAPAERELVFMSLDDVFPPPVPQAEPEPPPEPQPLPERVQAASAPAPAARPPQVEPEPAPEAAPSAPPPAAAQVMASVGGSAGGPVFTAGTEGGSAHGVGSAPRASETNPSASRVTEGTGTAVDVRGLMRGYQAALRGRVQPEVRYPRSAQIAGLEGTVMIGLLIDENGNILRRRVKRSSGHASLDSAALEGAERVASVPAPPVELRPHWTPQEITVPIRMSLIR